MKKKNFEREKKVDKKVLSFFALGFPTLVIIILGILFGSETWIIQILIAVYQFILLKQYLDNYYETW